MSEETIYYFTKSRSGFDGRILTILMIVALLLGELTIGSSRFNCAPILATLLFITNFKDLVWGWKPKRWACTVGPTNFIFESPEKSGRFPKNEIERILVEDRKKPLIVIQLKNGEYKSVPRECIGNVRSFRETSINLGYPIQLATA